MGLRGPQARPMVQLNTTIPHDLDDALNALVLISGTSKASIIREGLALYAVAAGTLLDNDAKAKAKAKAIVPTRTMGPGVSSIRNRSNK